MRLHTLIGVLLCAIVAATLALAAGIDGKWTAKVPGRDGQTRDVAFTFKVDGGKLTGATTGRGGQEIAIADGKVDGDTISFTTKLQFNDNTIVMKYTGTVAGDEIKFRREGGQGQPREFTAKRAN
jgi:hypothetical protein